MFDQRDCQLIIIGAGGHGSELASYVHDLVRHGEKVQLVGFVDEGKPSGQMGVADILGGFDALQAFLLKNADTCYSYITAVGNNQARRSLVRKVEQLAAQNLTPWTLRHPHSLVGQEVEIGSGTCLAPGSIITTRAGMGKHCILNVNASISHDSLVDDFVNLNPGSVICGNVRINEGCYIGAGATVIDKISIGEWSVIGAGAVVIDDIPPYVTAVGVPARVIKHHNQ